MCSVCTCVLRQGSINNPPGEKIDRRKRSERLQRKPCILDEAQRVEFGKARYIGTYRQWYQGASASLYNTLYALCEGTRKREGRGAVSCQVSGVVGLRPRRGSLPNTRPAHTFVTRLDCQGKLTLCLRLCTTQALFALLIDAAFFSPSSFQ